MPAELSVIKSDKSLDPELSDGGAWLDYGEFRLRVARWGNSRFSDRLQRALSQPDVRRKMELDKLQPEEDRRLMDDVIANTVLVGWDGILDSGQPVGYSAEKAVELLGYQVLREEVVAFSKNNANFRLRAIAAGAEALKKSSNGGSPTAGTADGSST